MVMDELQRALNTAGLEAHFSAAVLFFSLDSHGRNMVRRLAAIQREVDTDGSTHALRALIDTIDATGGVYGFPDGMYAPVGDTDWPDLADAYNLACEALGVAPWVTTAEMNEDYEGDIEIGAAPPCPTRPWRMKTL